jgi:hypothetical protein
MQTTILSLPTSMRQELRQRVPRQGLRISCCCSDLIGDFKVMVLRHDLALFIV